MPRAPIDLTDRQREEVETLAALLNQDQIADYLGMSRTTFYEICKRDADVAERCKRGKAKAIAHVANGLLQKARGGDTTSMIFYLKTQAGWSETARLEHAGDAEAPVVVSDGITRLHAYLDGMASRVRRSDEDATPLLPAASKGRSS